MPSRRLSLVLAALVACPLMAAPAAAQTADGWVDALIQKKLVGPGDRVWLSPLELSFSAADLQFLDDLSAALIARKVTVVRDLAFPSSSASDLRQPLGMLKELGVTKVLSYTRARDEGSANFRVLEVPSGMALAVETITAEARQPDKPTIAETPYRPANYTRALGVTVSYLSGSGLTYRHWLENDWGFQVSGVPFMSLQEGQLTGFANLGLQAMMPIFKGDRVRLFGLLGFGAAYTANRNASYPDGNYSNPVYTLATRTDLGIAPGIGLDYLFFNNFALTAALGYTFSQTTRSDYQNGAPQPGLSPGGTIGALIYW